MDEQSWIAGFSHALKEFLCDSKGGIPFFFMSTYRACGLEEREAMFVLQLLAFSHEGKTFPLLDEVAKRMGIKSEELVGIIEKLMSLDYLKIDNLVEQQSGVHCEQYNLQPLIEKMAILYAKQRWGGVHSKQMVKLHPVIPKEKSLFLLFEEEFGRLLSPMECEMINKWMDEEQYPQALIKYALREAVFAGKLHFRYIDRILMEWHHQRIKTVDEAKQYSSKFRGTKH